jgi:hypothetical protein
VTGVKLGMDDSVERWRKLQAQKADLYRDRWNDFYCKGYGADPSLVREKLDALKFEQDKAMFNPHDYHLPDEPLFYTKENHPVQIDCDCVKCKEKLALTLFDNGFLFGIGVKWE